jgi:hypothetical protein
MELSEEEKHEIVLKQECNKVINKTEKASSYEFGSAGNRFKLYFEAAKDLLQKVKELREAGFTVEISAGI